MSCLSRITTINELINQVQEKLRETRDYPLMFVWAETENGDPILKEGRGITPEDVEVSIQLLASVKELLERERAETNERVVVALDLLEKVVK